MKKIFLYSLFYGATSVFLKLSAFLIFIYLAKIFFLDQMAIFGILYATQQALASFGAAGIMEVVVGQLKENQSKKQRAKLFEYSRFTFFFTASISISISFLLAKFFLNNFDISTLTYISVFLSGILQAWATLQSELFRLDERHSNALIFSFTPSFFGLFSGLSAVFLKKTPESFFLGNSLGLAVGVGALYFCKSDQKEKVVLSGAFSIFKKSLLFIGVAFFGWLSGYGNNFIIGKFFLSEQVARFTFSLTFGSMLLLIIGSLNHIWAPHFYKLIQKKSFEYVERKNYLFFSLLTLLIGFFGGLGIVIIPKILTFIGGNLLAYIDMQGELLLIFSSYLVLIPWWHCQNHFLASAAGVRLFKITVVSGVVGLVLLATSMYFLGTIGVYIGFFVQMLIRSAIITSVAKRYWPVKICWPWIIVGLFLIFIGCLLRFFNINIWLSLGIFAILGLLNFVTIKRQFLYSNRFTSLGSWF